MGSSGTGTVSHLAIESLKRAAGVDITRALPRRRSGLPGPLRWHHRHDVRRDPGGHADRARGPVPAAGGGRAERIGYVPELREVSGMAELLPGSGIGI
jgi:hypothetical protein